MPIARACRRIAVAREKPDARDRRAMDEDAWRRTVRHQTVAPRSTGPAPDREIDQGVEVRLSPSPGPSIPGPIASQGTRRNGPHPFAQHDRPRRRGGWPGGHPGCPAAAPRRATSVPRRRRSANRSRPGSRQDQIPAYNRGVAPLGPGIRPSRATRPTAPTIQQAVVAPIVRPTRMVIQAEGRERCHSRQRTGLRSSDGAGSTPGQPARAGRAGEFASRPDSSPSPWPVAFSRRPDRIRSDRASRTSRAKKPRAWSHQAVVVGRT